MGFRDHWLLFFHDRGQGDTFRSKVRYVEPFQPVNIPKGSMFFLHPFLRKSVSTHIPINPVSVRNKREGSVSWVYPICAQ